jgi:hypothetical protein
LGVGAYYDAAGTSVAADCLNSERKSHCRLP